jgi:hypothetical protein
VHVWDLDKHLSPFMKKPTSINIIFVSLIAFCGIFLTDAEKTHGQAPPPPPPPLIYSKPDPADVKEFIPDDKIFVANFPGIPTISRKEVNGATVTSYQVYRKGSHSIVTVTEFPYEIGSQVERAVGIVRENLLKMPKTSVKVDKSIEVDGQKGHEFEVLSDYDYRRIRLFMVGTRVIDINSDVTNWHIIGDKTKEEWRQETDRFFSSFKLSK